MMISLDKFVIGTAQFGMSYGVSSKNNVLTLDDISSILTYSKSIGISFLDTAPVYGNAESRIGEIGLQGWNVITKLPKIPLPDIKIENFVVSSVCASLTRLRIDKVYAILLHFPGQIWGEFGDAIYKSLLKLKEERLVEKIGISIYDMKELNMLLRYDFDVVQTPLNLIDRRIIDTGWANRLTSMNVEIHVRSVFLQGLLLMNDIDRPRYFVKWAALWERYDKWLLENKINRLSACLNYIYQHEAVNKILIGIENIKQLKMIVDQRQEGGLVFPEDISSNNPDLLNPSRWHVL